MAKLAVALSLLGIAPGMSISDVHDTLGPEAERHAPATGVLVKEVALANVDGVLDVKTCGDRVTQVAFEAIYHARPDEVGDSARQVANTVIGAKLRQGDEEVIKEGYVHSSCDRSIDERAGWVRCVASGAMTLVSAMGPIVWV